MSEPIFGTFDLASLSVVLFWLFFAGLVIYLQRENMREGYPLEDEDGNPSPNQGPFSLPYTKTFKMPHGRGDKTVPDMAREAREVRLSSNGTGMPLTPTGDPMADGVGPASWAPRRDVPELDGRGHPKIVPISSTDSFHVSAGRDPRGLPVQAADGAVVGRVCDLWIDEPEQLVRYLEIELDGGHGTRLLPMPSARIKKDRVKVHSIFGEHFPMVPTIKSSNQVTLLEEEKISAFYAGGKMYATGDRLGPQL